MSMQDRNRRPVVTQCPFTRQLIPLQSLHHHKITILNKKLNTLTVVNGDKFCTTSTSFCGRRAMVNKIWCRKLSRAWHQTRQETPPARIFSEPKCQNHVATWYLCYRWLICIAWLSIFVCSIFEIGSAKPLGNNHLWPIYLTNWDIILGVSQAILGLEIVTRRWNLQKTDDFEANNLAYGKVEKIYWFLYTVTSTLAIGVTVEYWAAVYDPKLHRVDPLNIMLHVCNSLLMISDLFVASVPLRLRYFWWCIIIASFYVFFSIIYYAAGGLDKRGFHYIYKVLDWKKPTRTLVIVLGAFVLMITIHCLLCYIAMLRDRLYNRTNKYSIRTPTSPTIDGDAVMRKEKHVEIV